MSLRAPATLRITDGSAGELVKGPGAVISGGPAMRLVQSPAAGKYVGAEIDGLLGDLYQAQRLRAWQSAVPRTSGARR